MAGLACAEITGRVRTVAGWEGCSQCDMYVVVFVSLYTWCVGTNHVHTHACVSCHMCAQNQSWALGMAVKASPGVLGAIAPAQALPVLGNSHSLITLID
jgi:hypothetical protein